MYLLVIEAPDKIPEQNTTSIIIITMGSIIVSMLAVSGCCRMLRNFWKRLAVIFIN